MEQRLGVEHKDPKDQRRGSSSLLSAAGIGYETRRKHSFQNADNRVFQEGNQVLMEDKDGNVTKLEVIEVRHKMGLLRKAVPTLPICIAIIFCLVNTLLPGIGTLLGAISLLCCGKCRHEDTSTGIKYGIIASLIQMLTAIFIIGWIYSIIYGVNMIQESMTRGAYEEKNGRPGQDSSTTSA